ncbi:hypothetical protein LCGC14_0767620, partial [marine sediment metagenome]
REGGREVQVYPDSDDVLQRLYLKHQGQVRRGLGGEEISTPREDSGDIQINQ